MAYGSQKYLFKRDNYEVRRNTTDEQLDALWAAVGLAGGPGSGIGITGEENTFAELPAASGHAGEYWSVLTTTGIIGFRKFAGLYRSDGSNWIYLGNPVALASDVANVPAGTISATDVQGAVNEIDSDLTAHVGSRGASHATSTTTEAGFISAADHLKLSGIQAAATANSSDATLLNRANHTGTQASSTITNFNTDVDARVTLQMSAHTGAADPHPGYLTTAEGNAAYALIAHSHAIADVTGLQPALDGKLGTGSEAATVNTINGRISAGTNVTISGSGTAASPYVINASGGGGGSSGDVVGPAGSLDGPAVDPGRTFNINEKTYAGYAQANYAFDAGSVTIDGELGLRAVRTETETNGTLFSTTGPTAVNFKTAYTDWLPSANMRIQFTPAVQARFAYTQTRTRPNFAQLNPALRLAPATPCTVGQTDCIRTGSGGNPFLKPLDSDNYDASLEYYFSRTGFASIGIFRRDMKGFIANRAFEFPEPDPETGRTLVISGPVNTREARIKGVEAQVSSFFDFLPGWLSGFGAQANITYIDAKAEFGFFCPATANAPCVAGPGAPNAATLRTRIPDVSRWTYNLVGMYERDGLTLRLAYNHRSSFPEADRAERDGFFTLQGRGNPVSRLDWSSSYAINDNVTFFFDWTNILNNPFKSDIVRVNYPGGVPSAEEIFPMLVRQEESVLSGGIRFRF
jgi:TonB-dependent receptor